MAIFVLMWGTVTSALAVRQPYVELMKPNGAPAEVTILLDYQTEFSFWSWGIALRNRHWLVAACLFLSLVMSIVSVPLTGHLFITASVISNATISLQSLTTYNDSAYTSRTDLRPVFDLISATRIYGGNPPAWTNEEYAFQPFSLVHEIDVGNITVPNLSYSARINCQTISSSDYNLNFTSGPSNGGIIAVNATDRNCPIPQRLTVVDTTQLYVKTWSTECHFLDGWSRLSILAAQYLAEDPTRVTNFSLISWYVLSIISSKLE